MGLSLKKIASAGLAPVTGGASLLKGPSNLIGGGLDKTGGFLGNIFGGAFKDKFTDADPEAAELKRIKMLGAKGEELALNKFRERLDADTSGLIRGDIARENLGLIAGRDDARRSMMDTIKQRGLGNSSIGINAAANLERSAANDIAANTSMFRRRLDDENFNRLNQFRGVAAGTLAGQNVPINFTPTKEDSFAKTLVRGAITSGANQGAKAGMSAMMGGM